ncbi:hypothetical protein [Roseibium alexandrii]|uniref:hypothetical protein n=1 Tax=Roseibium alexandrii TaxID=388408 RepID=UPI0002F8E7B2|nr:hypothetical protein [Roseibium alexandrii]
MSDKTSAAMAGLNQAANAREAYLKAPSTRNAEEATQRLDDLRELVMPLHKAVADGTPATDKLGSARQKVEELEGTFKRLTSAMSAQLAALETVMSTSAKLSDLTHLIGEAVTKEQQSAVAAAQVAKATQDAARLYGIAAAEVETQAKSLAPRFGHGGQYKAKDLTDDVMAEINDGISKMIAAAERLETASLATLKPEDTKLLADSARAFPVAL